jgi:basic membrane protein A
VTYKGLKEGGVDWALDKDNRAIVPRPWKSA